MVNLNDIVRAKRAWKKAGKSVYVEGIFIKNDPIKGVILVRNKNGHDVECDGQDIEKLDCYSRTTWKPLAGGEWMCNNCGKRQKRRRDLSPPPFCHEELCQSYTLYDEKDL